MTSIRHSATLGIGSKLAPSWSASVGAVASGTGKIKSEIGRLKVASHEASNALKDMLASGRYYGQSADRVHRLRDEHERLTTALAHEERRLRNLAAWNEIDAGKRASAALGRIGSGLAKVGKTAAVAAGAMGAAGVGAVAWFTKSAIDATSAVETIQTSLETLEGSPEKAKQSMAWIQKFAKETPYEMNEVAEAYTRLRAYGIDPTNGSLRTLGDTAGSLGKPIMAAVEALADAVTGENERLKEFGIRSKTAGDKITYFYKNAAGADVQKTVKKTSQTMIAATLSAIWNEKYAGGMAKQSRTWKGLTSNLSDAWSQFQVRVMQTGPFERMKAQLGGLQARIDQWASNGTLDRWAHRIGDAYGWLFDKLEKGFTWLDANWESKVVPGLKKAYDATLKVADVGIKVVSWLSDAVGGAGNLVLGLGALGAAKTLKPLGDLAKVGWDIVSWLSSASGLTGKLARGLGGLFGGAGTAAAGGAATAGGAAAGGAAAGTAGAAGAAGLGLGASVAALAVGMPVAAYGGWKAAEYAITKYNANFGLSDDQREARLKERKRKQGEAGARVRAMREANDNAARAAAERDGLMVAPAPVEWKPPPSLRLVPPSAPEVPTVPVKAKPWTPRVITTPQPASSALDPAQSKPNASIAPEPQPLTARLDPGEAQRMTVAPPPPPPAPVVHKYDQRRIEVNINAQGADAKEVARLVEQKLQSEALASYE